ncbi:MAG: hypothetical protein HS113_30930, partial [Verrucomicrobiales bacterium]|nr:hypothetical protein [Verrucomicrobiales bacterium]
TGIAEDRCPECGKPFDREQLLEALAGAPMPIPIWDDRDRNIVLRFVYICLLAWFRPIHLSRLLPKNHSAVSARRFRRATLAVAAVMGFGASTAANGPLVGLGVLAACGVPYLVAIVATELMLASTFEGATSTGLPPGTCPEPARFAWWQGVFGFFRSFVLLEIVVVGGVIALFEYTRWQVSPEWLLGLPVAWWWLSVCAVLVAQPAPTSGKIATILMSPIFIGMAVVVAACAGALVAIFTIGIFGL